MGTKWAPDEPRKWAKKGLRREEQVVVSVSDKKLNKEEKNQR
jgi:hypothetical protein